MGEVGGVTHQPYNLRYTRVAFLLHPLLNKSKSDRIVGRIARRKGIDVQKLIIRSV